MKSNNIFYNHIAAERIDIIDKLAYLYWYENVCKDDWDKDRHIDLYERTKSEVMDYGRKYFENN